jgi:hypothetical protein
MQTGERASTEDAKDWAHADEPPERLPDRRNHRCGFTLLDVGIIPPAQNEEITVGWSDLLAPSQAEKIANMDKLADVAVKSTNAFGRSAITETKSALLANCSQT